MGAGTSGNSGSGQFSASYGQIVQSTLQSTGSIPVAPNSPYTRCSTIGHRLIDLVAYKDGLIVGRCELCEDRVEIPGLPFGDLLLRAKELIDRVMKDGVDAQLLDDAMKVMNEILETQEALEDARDTIDLLTNIVRQQTDG